MTREEQIQKLIDEENGIDNYGFSDYQVEVLDDARFADENLNFKTIAEYLYKEKGYSDSLNGYKYITTFKEIMKDVQIYNNYKKDEWIEKACNWLREQKEMIGISFQEDFIERFKMAMKK